MNSATKPVNIFAVGAVHAYLEAACKLPGFSHFNLALSFAPAGVINEQVRTGKQADIIITTAHAIDALARDGFVLDDSAISVGVVDLALAQRTNDPPLAMPNAEALRGLLLNSDAIYLPDTAHSTAGRHIARVLDELGIATAVSSKLHQFANGAAAMQALADSDKTSPIGFTQRPEIAGVKNLAARSALPAPFVLLTHYMAALSVRSAQQPDAQKIISLICDPDLKLLRQRYHLA